MENIGLWAPNPVSVNWFKETTEKNNDRKKLADGPCKNHQEASAVELHHLHLNKYTICNKCVC